MLSKILIMFTAIVSLSLLGCGGKDDSGSSGVTCSYFQQEDNCWRQTVEAMSACVWGTSSAGTLAGDGSSCTMSNYAVTYNTPVNTSSPTSTDPWDFAVTKDGTPCMSFKETDTGIIAQTSLGTFSEYLSGSNVIVNCPDGTQKSMPVSEAMNCLASLPGTSVVSSGSGFTFGFLGHPTETASHRCE